MEDGVNVLFSNRSVTTEGRSLVIDKGLNFFLLTLRCRQDKPGADVQNATDSGFHFSGLSEDGHINLQYR